MQVVGALLIILLPPAYPRADGKHGGVIVTPLLNTLTTASGQPIILPKGRARLIVSTYEIAPGVKLPVHRHLYPRYAYVLDGQLRVTEVKTHRKFDYKKDEFAVEMVGPEHFGENTGKTPLRLLVIDIVPRNVNNNTRP